MRSNRILSLAAAAVCMLLGRTIPAHAQLYGDPGKDVTSGDLNSQDYWWTKYDMMMLDLAQKQHQPEGRIAVNLASTSHRLDELMKKYPKHEELKKWKKHVDEAQAKLDAGADRTKTFGPECPWDESNFAQIWVNSQWAKMLYDAKDYEQALSLMNNVMGNYDIMLKPERMKDYPEELSKWVRDAKPESEKLMQKIKEKTGGGGGSKAVQVSDVASGELNSQDYWWTKFDLMMLDIAIKQHQPEGRIAVDLASTTNRLNDLSKAYPKHEEIQKMKKQVEDISGKIDPKAERSKNFSPECPWDESNFAQLWVNWHWAKAALAAKDDATARSCMQNVMQNLDVMLKPERMKDYPEELSKWVTDTKPEADKLSAELKAKRR